MCANAEARRMSKGMIEPATAALRLVGSPGNHLIDGGFYQTLFLGRSRRDPSRRHHERRQSCPHIYKAAAVSKHIGEVTSFMLADKTLVLYAVLSPSVTRRRPETREV